MISGHVIDFARLLLISMDIKHALRKAEDRKKIRKSQNGVIYLKRNWNRPCHGFRRHLDVNTGEMRIKCRIISVEWLC